MSLGPQPCLGLCRLIQFILPYFKDESDNRSNRSSFGLLPKECLEVTQSITGDETFEWQLSKSILKTPSILPKTSSKKSVVLPDELSIGDQYLKPTLERLKGNQDETTPLDQLLGSTMGNNTIHMMPFMNEI